jgi:hypothetical protein
MFNPQSTLLSMNNCGVRILLPYLTADFEFNIIRSHA